jgi:hypothetical protein
MISEKRKTGSNAEAFNRKDREGGSKRVGGKKLFGIESSLLI